MPTRRRILVTGAASAVIIGGGLFAYDIFSPSLAEAREPWRQAAEGFGDPRLDILAYAILAPNPHNKQPWLIELIGEDGIRITADLDRMLPETDPPCRQITIGFGAFLEQLRMAAAEKGYRAEITPFPEGEPQPVFDDRPIADIRLVREPGIATDPLFDLVLERHTNREHYEPRPVTDRQFAALRAALPDGIAMGWANEAGQVEALKAIATDAWLIEYRTPRTLQESIDVMRIGADEAVANPDGIILDGPVMEAANNLGIVTRQALADPDSYAFAEGITMYTALIDASPSMLWLHTPDNSRATQLATGAAWLRVQLAATREGLAMQPLSQVLQEFPEMAGQYVRLHEHLGIAAPARVQGLFRIGHAPAVQPAPRWPLTSRLIDA
ncbi:twin-arginine translocation pathway signal protein [Parasphingopyxis algicola]|uniref:Acg family FMN-binding oxidoreductase n=1 Tax=Parasphingopyxis algicola TaxID=2026624 RepID=UPI0015A04F8D|nr:nitroreductase family protein [Parasphingopyxis algicola]QLC25827.1 twin-arginine translocation pathway signal protein [Parasphingopyxis algicola]